MVDHVQLLIGDARRAPSGIAATQPTTVTFIGDVVAYTPYCRVERQEGLLYTCVPSHSSTEIW